MFDKSQLKQKMQKSIDNLTHNFSSLRAGRVTASFLDPVKVEAYGSKSPLSQVASINVLDNFTLSVSVWDKSMVGPVEKAIRESNLGVNPSTEGQLVRVTLPRLTEERRKELAKVAKDYSEQAKVSIRNIRRDELEHQKQAEKNKEISQDDLKKGSEEVQKVTDEFISKIEDLLTQKEKDILNG